MPRNTLKSFPTAALRRGMANFHPSSRAAAQPYSGPEGRDGGRGRDGMEPPVTPVIPTGSTELELAAATG
jgi:hypothetical protein